jgi:hypothetical protein
MVGLLARYKWRRARKAQLVVDLALFDFQYLKLLGLFFAGNNQATPTNSLITASSYSSFVGTNLKAHWVLQGLQAAA